MNFNFVQSRYMSSIKRKTAKKRHTRKATKKPKEIQHHHFLLRMETKTCPSENDKDQAKQMLEQIVSDIDMKLLAAPHVYYVKYPRYNEGLTAIAPIETSHIAFHFWLKPNPKILSNPSSRCLLEFDVYTCGSLTLHNIQRILHHLTQYQPTHVNATLLNRKHSLAIERHMKWDANDTSTWQEWLKGITEA